MADERTKASTNPAAATRPDGAIEPAAKAKDASVEHRDSVREVVETVVFVIILVLLLKSFIAEAFIIPTGSMAPTLLGYNDIMTCPQCRFSFPLNIHAETGEDRPGPEPVVGCICPNCRFPMSRQSELLRNRPPNLPRS